MSKSLKAIYRRGAFFPKTPCHLPEDSEVELIVQGPVLSEPEVVDAQERANIISQLVARMQRNVLPDTAPRFSRESLHKRS